MIALGPRLVIATHNKGKLAELRTLLEPLGVAVTGASEMALPEPEETEDTFAGNARLKAEAACRLSSLPALADDSGIVVDAMGGAPGVHSARFADGDFGAAMARILAEVAGKPRGASFVAVLALARPDEPTATFEGVTLGTLADTPRGTGFGYDPIFIPNDGDGRTFGEMSPVEKAGTPPLSHRARAVARFMAALERPGG